MIRSFDLGEILFVWAIGRLLRVDSYRLRAAPVDGRGVELKLRLPRALCVRPPVARKRRLAFAERGLAQALTVDSRDSCRLMGA